jgi:uncharacterized protein (PEP-CTERM system associated)
MTRGGRRCDPRGTRRRWPACAAAAGDARALLAAAALAGCSAAAAQVPPYVAPGGSAPPVATPSSPGTATASSTQPVITPVISVQETLTNNVDLDRGTGQRRGDLITQITPSIQVRAFGAHSELAGTLAAPILLYARTGEQNNRVLPEVNLRGVADWEKRLFLEGDVTVSQQYFNPFGARPLGISNSPVNEYTAATYRLSPYVQGEMPNHIRYTVRDSNYWTTTSSAPATIGNAYTNEATADIEREPTPLGFGLQYRNTRVNFATREPALTEITRYQQRARIDPQLEAFVSGGYERDDYSGQRFNGTIYGAGATWHPTDRTTVDGRWEHRFFGASYRFAFDHRTPLTVWHLQLARDASTYPEQLATLAAGGNVPGLLDSLFRSRIPDPAARQQFVDQFIRDRDLPLTLTGPVTIFNERVSLVESANASVGIIGARNSVVFSAYRSRTTPLAGGGNIADVPDLVFRNVQMGTDVVWTHQLAPLLLLRANALYLQTDALAPSTGRTRQGGATLSLTTLLSPLTSVFGGVRYQVLRSDVNPGYDEAALFVGLNHLFR